MSTNHPNKAIHLSNGVTVLTLERRDGTSLSCTIDTADYELVRLHRWSAHVKKNTYYAETKIEGKKVRLHKLLLSGASLTDHEDGNGLNNRRANLRPATDGQNCANRKKTAGRTSVYKGVYLYKRYGKFRAYIGVNGKKLHLGYFTNEEDAALAYNVAATKHHGEFAKLNVLPEVLKVAA